MMGERLFLDKHNISYWNRVKLIKKKSAIGQNSQMKHSDTQEDTLQRPPKYQFWFRGLWYERLSYLLLAFTATNRIIAARCWMHTRVKHIFLLYYFVASWGCRTSCFTCTRYPCYIMRTCIYRKGLLSNQTAGYPQTRTYG